MFEKKKWQNWNRKRKKQEKQNLAQWQFDTRK
jgi:hypothetical protein